MTLESKKKPLVSIIMPTYNRDSFLLETVKNILSQTYEEFELIIIDDCSIDKTSEILAKLVKEDSRIKYLRNETNIKIIKTLNKGLQVAKGVYIARADDDDPWIDREKLEKQILFLEKNSEYVLIGTGAIAVNENNKELFRYLEPEHDEEIRSLMLLNNPFINSTAVFRKSILEEIGNYDENHTDVEDWDLWMRMGMHGKLYNLPLYSIFRFYGSRGVSVRNRRNMSHARLLLIKQYRKNYPNFILALILNNLQRIYSFFPYFTLLDNFLFKFKKKLMENSLN